MHARADGTTVEDLIARHRAPAEANMENLKTSMQRIVIHLISLLIIYLAFIPTASAGEVRYEEDSTVGAKLNMPVNHWYSSGRSPCGLVIAVHGVAMHASSYDVLARRLAAMGFDVFSTDLRGYGRHMHAANTICDKPDCTHKVNYDKSFDDLVTLAQHLRIAYPNVPIHFVGESLGSSLAIRMAAQHPELVDGLVLAAPAIKRHSFMHRKMVAQAGSLMYNFRHQLDLTPYVQTFASDDPAILAEMARDPLMRTRMSAGELLKARAIVLKTLKYAQDISPDTPVLVIQGSADRCIKANAVVLLLHRLRSKDQTVRWFHQRGHILLETAHVKPDTMQIVCGWLHEHVDGSMYSLASPRFVARTESEDQPVLTIDGGLRPQMHF